jgi:putative proteasome-type protease
MMLIYPQGNYITASQETPYLQIGESKYGKPALDRIVHPGMSLAEGARLCLVSLDATTRSNITVGPPFEVATYNRDSLSIGYRCRFEAEDPHLVKLRDAWNNGIQKAFHDLPPFEWENEGREQMPLQTLSAPGS